MIGTFILMIAVFVGAYFASKFVGKHYKPHSGNSKNVTIIDSTTIGKGRSILVVRAAGKVMLIGSTAQEFTMLTELDASKFEDINNEPKAPTKDFVSTFKDVVANMKRKSAEGDDN